MEREIGNNSLAFQHREEVTWTENACVCGRVGTVTLTCPSFLWVLHMEVATVRQYALKTLSYSERVSLWNLEIENPGHHSGVGICPEDSNVWRERKACPSLHPWQLLHNAKADGTSCHVERYSLEPLLMEGSLAFLTFS